MKWRLKMKKLLFMILILVLLLSTQVHAEQNITLSVDGVEVKLDQQPYLNDNSELMIPLRFIDEVPLGIVMWDQETEMIMVYYNDRIIKFKANSFEVDINNDIKIIESEIVLKNSSTYVPECFVIEALGLDLKWNFENQRAEILTDEIGSDSILESYIYGDIDETEIKIADDIGDLRDRLTGKWKPIETYEFLRASEKDKATDSYGLLLETTVCFDYENNKKVFRIIRDKDRDNTRWQNLYLPVRYENSILDIVYDGKQLMFNDMLGEELIKSVPYKCVSNKAVVGSYEEIKGNNFSNYLASGPKEEILFYKNYMMRKLTIESDVFRPGDYIEFFYLFEKCDEHLMGSGIKTL